MHTHSATNNTMNEVESDGGDSNELMADRYSSDDDNSTRNESYSSSDCSDSDDNILSSTDDNSDSDEESDEHQLDSYNDNIVEEEDLSHEMNNIHIDDDDDGYGEEEMHIMHHHPHRMIILVLSTLLAALLTNFGYQLYRLSNASTTTIRGEKDMNDIQAKSHIASSYTNPTTDNTKGSNTRDNNSQIDNEDYQMPPPYPARIYTHKALSSKNYRAGGTLSDEMLQRYEEDGVIVIRNLVSPQLLDRLDKASQVLIDDQNDDGKDSRSKKRRRRGKQFHMVKNGAIFLGVPPPPKDEQDEAVVCNTNTESGDECHRVDEDTPVVDNNDNNLILSSFREMALYTKIPRVAASLLRLDELRVGGEEYLQHNSKRRRRQNEESDEGENSYNIDESVNLRVCRDIFLTKDDDDYACGWHVDDTGFWPSLASDPGINAWIALDDMPWTGNTSVATFSLSLGSHRASWRHEAYQVTGSTHTNPLEGFTSAEDLIKRRSGSGTCNIKSSAPHLYEKLEKNKVIYDLRRGDVIFHDRWVFHRTVTVSEAAKEQGVSEKPQTDKLWRRYSIRYSSGTAIVPPGFGVELSVLHDSANANRTLDEIVERSGPWYPKAWPHSQSTAEDETIEGIEELVHEKIPKAEQLQKDRKKQIQQLLKRGGQEGGYP